VYILPLKWALLQKLKRAVGLGVISTALIPIKDKWKQLHLVWPLLDSCKEVRFITEGTATQFFEVLTLFCLEIFSQSYRFYYIPLADNFYYFKYDPCNALFPGHRWIRYSCLIGSLMFYSRFTKFSACPFVEGCPGAVKLCRTPLFNVKGLNSSDVNWRPLSFTKTACKTYLQNKSLNILIVKD